MGSSELEEGVFSGQMVGKAPEKGGLKGGSKCIKTWGDRRIDDWVPKGLAEDNVARVDRAKPAGPSHRCAGWSWGWGAAQAYDAPAPC